MRKNSFSRIVFIAMISMGLPAGAQWLPTNNPPIGGVNAFLVHGGAVYAASSPAGVYKSTDSGKTWTTSPMAPRVSPLGLAGSGVVALAGMGRWIYAGTLDSLQRSGDGGRTWERCNKGIPTNYVDRLATGHGVVYVASHKALVRSLDSGATWAPAKVPESGYGIASLTVLDSTIYLGMENGGLYRSGDRGETWTALPIAKAFEILCVHRTQGILFAAEAEGSIYRSTDGGATWTGVRMGGDEFRSVTGTPNNLYAASDRGLYRSTDTGKTWHDVSDDRLYVLDREFRAVATDGEWTWAGGAGGAMRIPAAGPGTGPAQSNFGLGREYLTAVGSSGTRFYAGCATKGYHGRLRGTYWQRVQSYGYLTPVAYLPFAGGMYVATVGRDVGAGIDHITDIDAHTYDHPADSGLRQTNVYALARIGNVLFAGSDKGVHRSADTARFWVPANGNVEVQPTRVLISGGSGGTSLFAGSPARGLLRSTDQGATWTPIGAGLKNPVTALAYAGGALVAAADSGRELHRSLDQGATWSRAQDGMAAPAVTALASSGTRLLAGTSHGLYRSLDGGASWHPFMEGMFSLTEGVSPPPDFHVTSLAVGSQYLVAGTARGTVWQRPVADLSLAAGAGERPTPPRQARRRFDPARGGMVFESLPVRGKPASVSAQGRHLPESP